MDEFGCESQCNGTQRIQASRTPTGSCFFFTQENSPLCTDSETSQAIDNQETHCADSSTLNTFIEKIGDFDSIKCQEGFVCSPFPVEFGNPGSCITEAEAEQGATDSIGGQELTNELIEATQSRLFWAIVIILVITLPIMLTVAMFTKDGNATFFTAIIIAIIVTVFFSALDPPWIPLEYMALIVLVCVLGAVALLKDVIS